MRLTTTSELPVVRTEADRVPVRIADQIVASLKEAGVQRVFGIPGGVVSGVFDALIDADIEVVICQHEGMAAYLAYGHARATGTPGVIAVTAGPGIFNSITGIAAAYTDEVPLLLLAGEVSTRLGGRGVLQDGGPEGLDVTHMLRPVTKLADSVQQPQRTPALVAQALDVAMAHPRGPAFLRIPLDVSLAMRPSMQIRQAVRGEAAPDPEVCDIVAHSLMTARRPAILLGIGARVAEVGEWVQRIAERVRCPVITDVEAKGVFPESHGLSLGLFGVGGGPVAQAYLQGGDRGEGVDFLLTIGARLDDTTTSGFSELLRPAGGTVVQLDHDPRRLCRAYDADHAMAADLPRALRAIEARVRSVDAMTLLRRDKQVRDARAADDSHLQRLMGRGPHHPIAAVRALQRAFPADTIWTSDIGNHLLAAARYLRVDHPDAFHVSVGLGGMGSGIGVAMGLAMGRTDERRVVGICGDGSLRMVGNELATCAKYGIPVTLAVFNDARFGMVAQGMDKVYGRVAWCDSPDVDVVAFARSLGAEAIRIETEADLARAAELAGNGPLVLDIPIDPDVFVDNPRNHTFKE
jgi:acetolactate synthase-1/2/3 large subunit